MSKTRFDRKKRIEQWQSSYTPFKGGLDQTSSALTIKPGRMSQGLNYEEVFGKQGYRTIRGYERIDGRDRPSLSTYTIVNFKTGTAAFAQGDAVTNLAGTATGTVVYTTVTSGSFGGGDAAGYLIICKAVGAWVNLDQIRVGGVQRATTTGASTIGGLGFAANVTATRATREYLRGLIQKVPGEGSVLGGAVFNGELYAVRNIVGGTSATLWKATTAGWAAIKTFLMPGGNYRFEVQNFTGDPSRFYLFGISGKCRLFRIDSAGAYTAAAPIFGSEALSATALAIGTGAKAWTLSTLTRNYVAGDAVTAWDTTNPANFMSGTVTSYAANVLTVNVTSTGGAGSPASWEIGRADFADKPFLITSHKNHMWLAFPRGQLQTSNLGDPMLYTTTASLFGIGEEITGFLSLRGKTLAVYTRKRTKLYTGSSSTDWNGDDISKQMGAIINTAQDNGGNGIFLNTKGLTTMQATQQNGDFEAAILSANAKTFIDAKLSQVIGTRMAKNNYQYRIYYSDGVNLRGTIQSGAAVLTEKSVSFTPAQYIHTPTCVFDGVMADGNERMFFGTTDGYMMEEDAGTSFDGTAINYSLRLPFDHLKAPALRKELMKLELELDCPDASTLYFKSLFDYDDSTYLAGGEVASTLGVGAQFDLSLFDNVQFDLPAVSRVELPTKGTCRNVSLLLFFTSDYVRPLNLQGLLWYYVPLGMQK